MKNHSKHDIYAELKHSHSDKFPANQPWSVGYTDHWYGLFLLLIALQLLGATYIV